MVCGLSVTATKILIVLLSVLTAGFLIATIVLGVEYNDLKSSTDGATTTPTTEPPLVPKIDFRLPGNIIPSAYRLRFGGTDLMNGIAEIDFRTLEDTNEILLHAREMRPVFISVYRYYNFSYRRQEEVDTFELDAEREFLVVKMKRVLNAGRDYYIRISYFQSVSDTRRIGLYKAYAGDESSGSEMFVANFQPTYARFAFPCFDEPSYKAKFTLTVAFPNNSNIVSNMMIKDTTEIPAWGQTDIVTFEESLPMSTYQLALFVGEFDSKKVTIQPNIGQSIDLKIHAANGDIANTNYALELGEKILKYFVDFFGEAYPLTKLDLVAVSNYSRLGGGGLGLLILDENLLIFDEQNESTEKKQSFALNLARELAQLWVGDMVTQKGWNDMWLYKGLSTYLAYQALNSIYPDWGVLDDFLINELHPALDFDFVLHIDSLAEQAESPEEILAKFNELSLKKSASLIRMYAYRLGQDNFRTACNQFVKTSIYENSPAYKFIDEFSIAVGDNVVKLSSDMFIRQTSFPVLDVGTQPQENVTIFFLSQNSTKEVRWIAPTSYKYKNSTEVSQSWLSDIPGGHYIAIDKGSWMKFNVDQRGYYRISYDADAWSALIDAMEGDSYEDLSIADRAGLINDALAFSYQLTLNPDVPLNLIKTLRKDMTFVPWNVGSTALRKMKIAFQEAKHSVNLKIFSQGIIQEAYNYVGWTPDSNHSKNKLRMVILDTACRFEYDPCLSEAKTYFDKWNYIRENRPHADIRQLVYSIGIASMNDESSWDYAYGKMKTENDPKEKLLLLKALAQTKVTYIVQKYLSLVGNTSEVPSEFHLVGLKATAENPIGLPIVWRYLQDNWDNLTSAHGLSSPELNQLLIFVVNQLYTEVRFSEVTQFFYKHQDIPRQTYRQALVSIVMNFEWLANRNDEIGMWLTNNTD